MSSHTGNVSNKSVVAVMEDFFADKYIIVDFKHDSRLQTQVGFKLIEHCYANGRQFRGTAHTLEKFGMLLPYEVLIDVVVMVHENGTWLGVPYSSVPHSIVRPEVNEKQRIGLRPSDWQVVDKDVVVCLKACHLQTVKIPSFVEAMGEALDVITHELNVDAGRGCHNPSLLVAWFMWAHDSPLQATAWVSNTMKKRASSRAAFVHAVEDKTKEFRYTAPDAAVPAWAQAVIDAMVQPNSGDAPVSGAKGLAPQQPEEGPGATDELLELRAALACLQSLDEVMQELVSQWLDLLAEMPAITQGCIARELVARFKYDDWPLVGYVWMLLVLGLLVPREIDVRKL